MSEPYDYGPVQQYEITWMSGHVETVLAHQVSYPNREISIFAGSFGSTEADNGPARVQLHAQIDGRWRLTLSALEQDIRTMRLVTGGELIPGGES